MDPYIRLILVLVVGLLVTSIVSSLLYKPSLSTEQELYNKAILGNPVLSDPFSDNSSGRWIIAIPRVGVVLSLEMSIMQSTNGNSMASFCFENALTFSDFLFQVDMSITKSDSGGIVFSADPRSGKYYHFLMYRNGNYSLSVFQNFRESSALQSGTLSTTFDSGTIAVAAKGQVLYLYANGQFLARASNTSFSSGYIGVFAKGFDNLPTEVEFTNEKAWTT